MLTLSPMAVPELVILLTKKHLFVEPVLFRPHTLIALLNSGILLAPSYLPLALTTQVRSQNLFAM